MVFSIRGTLRLPRPPLAPTTDSLSYLCQNPFMLKHVWGKIYHFCYFFLKMELWTSKQVKNDATGCGNILHYREFYYENCYLFVTFLPNLDLCPYGPRPIWARDHMGPGPIWGGIGARAPTCWEERIFRKCTSPKDVKLCIGGVFMKTKNDAGRPYDHFGGGIAPRSLF